MEFSERVEDLYVNDEHGVLFRESEVVDGKPPKDAVIVQGVVRTFALHPGRLEALRESVVALTMEIVSDKFMRGKGDGASFLELCYDRNGSQWGEHRSVEAFMCLAIGLGLAGYCLPREMWPTLPGSVPYVWFQV